MVARSRHGLVSVAPFVDPKAFNMKFTNRFQILVAFAAGILLLAGCGGGGGSDATAPALQPPPLAVPSLQVVGAPADANAVYAPVCADPYAVATVGLAATVRYPVSTGSFRGWPTPSGSAVVYGSPMQMRTDRAGGLVVSHYTDANGAMFRVAANGDKSVLPIPYGSIFDVAADGTVWFVRNGALFVATQNGTVANVATLGNSAAAVDGPLGSAPLGPVTLIAAGKDKVYLLVEEATANVTGTPSPVAFTRSLRELSRSPQISGGWVVKTLPLWTGLQTVDVISAMRVSSTDQLAVLVNEPFKQLLSQQMLPPGGFNVGTAYQYRAEARVRALDAVNHWTDLAGEAYVLDVLPSYSGLSFQYSLDAKDLALAANGDIWVGGAGAIFKVDRAGGWQRVANPAQHPSDQVGRDGKLAEATFASASQMVADNPGITFYDGETCQIRRLENGNIATLSGPQLGGPHFTAARFLGQDGQGDLLLANGSRNGPGNGDVIRGSYLGDFALLRAAIATPSFGPFAVKSLAAKVAGARCAIATTYRAGPALCTGLTLAGGSGIWLGIGTRGVLARIGNDFLAGLDRGDGTTVSSTTTWPGILNGDAPSGPSGIHADGTKLYLFGWMRTDPPVSVNTYHELRLYEIDTSTSAVSVVAGASIASKAFNGMKVDLSPVIPGAGGGPAFVQRRSDGKFWLSNGKEIWLLDALGQL